MLNIVLIFWVKLIYLFKQTNNNTLIQGASPIKDTNKPHNQTSPTNRNTIQTKFYHLSPTFYK